MKRSQLAFRIFGITMHDFLQPLLTPPPPCRKKKETARLNALQCTTQVQRLVQDWGVYVLLGEWLDVL